MIFTVRARLTALYFLVLASSFAAFVFICDFGFRRSIEITVNDASRHNLEVVRRVLEKSQDAGLPAIQNRLRELAGIWANGAIFEAAGADGQWLYRAPEFLSAFPALPPLRGEQTEFATTNLDALQYRVARQKILWRGRPLQLDAAVPTEPFDQALDNFRLIEKRFLPLLVVLASLLGYWMSGRALAPVNRIIEGAEGVGLRNLSARLEVPKARDELRRLTETLNAMLARIETSVQRITRFTADASHDLRTPLAIIRTNAELALRRPRNEAEYQDSLRRILVISEETTELIEKLLMLARADANMAQFRKEPVSLALLLHRVAQKSRVLAQGKGIALTELVPAGDHILFGDEPTLERLFLSLLDNAVKYTPPGGQVTLALRGDASQAIVEILDTGIGIDAHDLPHVFERFYRADRARSRETRGSGLGLSIAKWIAEAHGGSISARSEYTRGSLFTVRFPLTPSLERLPEPDLAPRTPTHQTVQT